MNPKVSCLDISQEPVKKIELFDPHNETWKVIGILKKSRIYQTSAILLPDGTVLVGGITGAEGELNTLGLFVPYGDSNQDFEIIVPPYLDNDPIRPEINEVPVEVKYNIKFEVTTPDAKKIKKVSLIKPSSTTYNNNMDQRCLMLDILEQTDSTLKLQSPKDGTYATPGYYMLFIIDGNNVPSIGKFLLIG